MRRAYPELKCEIEVDDLTQLDQVLEMKPELVMLDNFEVWQTQIAVQRRAQVSPATQLESSGGLTLDVAREYASCGVDFLAVGADDAETADHAGETGEAQAGAVGARGHRAGQRLRVDVALVGQRQSARAQNARHVAQAGARAQRHGAGIGVRADETGHLVQLHPVAVGDGDRGEGMAGAKGTHGASRRRGVPDDAADFLGVRRLMHGARHARLGAGPVAPPLFVHE